MQEDMHYYGTYALAAQLEVYQAASYHRHYTLKHLLPNAGIVVL